MFDLALVFAGILHSWIIPLLFPASSTSMLSQIMVLRLVRLLRLVRAFRFTPILSEAWKLARGMINSTSQLCSMLVMLIAILYGFACLGIELITKNNVLTESHPDLVYSNFSSIPEIMLTLIQFVTLDSIAALYAPLIKEQPYLLLYFFPMLLMIAIALMNVVTAVIVERALVEVHNDKEEEKSMRRRTASELK